MAQCWVTTGNPAASVPLTFTVTAGGASVTLPSANTQINGTTSSWQLGVVSGTDNNDFTVSVDSDPSRFFVVFKASRLLQTAVLR